MAEEVANVARRVNATVEEGKDSLGKIKTSTASLEIKWMGSLLTSVKRESNF